MAGQRLTVRAAIEVLDDEFAGHDVREHELRFGDVIVGNDDVPLELLTNVIRVDGEVRSELELYARRDGDAQVHIDGIARLFEGSTTNTTDLEESRVISLTVPLSQTVDHSFRLENHESSEFGRSEDYAQFDLQFRNVPAGVTLISGGSLYATLPKQDQWRFCHKCHGLWFAGHDTAGRCPRGGGHSLDGSGNYALVDGVNFSGGQPNWRFCQRCQGLWFSGAGGSGSCPAGGGHSREGSGNYVLTGDGGIDGQYGWRWCQYCSGLWFSDDGFVYGRCPKHGNAHSIVGSGSYVLTGQI